MFRVRIAYVAWSLSLSLSLSLLPATESHCHGSRNGYRAGSVGDLVQNDKVLLGHVFATFFVQNFSHCFAKCEVDCRCRSFNLPVSGMGECELNDANNSTALTKPRRGWRYHHLEMTELRQGADTCYQPYENGCCANEPCRNATGCVEIPDHGKPTFKCTCITGSLGASCDRKIQSCFDYLWNNKTAASGYYDVWDVNNNSNRVFCDMQPEQFEAWTLVMSHDQTVAGTYQSKPFFVNAPSDNQDTMTDYRLSLDEMKSVREAMGRKELEWKATCDYSFTDGQTTSDETVRSRFDTLDIMKFTTNERICHRVDYINIRGKECYNCNVWATQTNTETFTINAHRGDQDDGCNFKSGSTVTNENIFGVYKAKDPTTHACAAKADSTTQYWFGGKL